MRSWSCLLVHTRLTIQTTMLSGPKDSRFKTLKRLPSATRATVPTVPQLLDKDSNVHCKADRSSVHSLPRTYCLHTCRQATHELNALETQSWTGYHWLPGNCYLEILIVIARISELPVSARPNGQIS